MLHNNNFGWFVVSGLNNLVNTMKGHVSSCHFLWSMKKISNKSLFCSFLTNKICIDCIQTVKKRHLTSCRLSNSYLIENVFKHGTPYQQGYCFLKISTVKNYFELKKRRINIVNSCIFTSQILSSLLCTFLDMHLLSKWPKYFNHGAEKCYLWRCYLNKHIREERYSVLTTANLKIQGHSENWNNSPWGHIAHLSKNSYNWFNQLNHILFMVKI